MGRRKQTDREFRGGVSLGSALGLGLRPLTPLADGAASSVDRITDTLFIRINIAG